MSLDSSIEEPFQVSESSRIGRDSAERWPPEYWPASYQSFALAARLRGSGQSAASSASDLHLSRAEADWRISLAC